MKTHDIVLYGIPQCDTVRKARAWLAERSVPYQFHDYKKSGVPEENLAQWMNALGRDALLNKRGTTWRQIDADTQAGAVDDAGVHALLLAHPSAIKRPVVDWGPDAEPRFTVGFDPSNWATQCEPADRQK